MTWQQIEARRDRLHALSVEMGRDCYSWKEADDPLLYLERRAVLDAMHKLWGAVEEARVVLSEALSRRGRSKRLEK